MNTAAAGQPVAESEPPARGEDLPTGSYAALAALHAADFAAFLVLMRKMGKPVPEQISAGDIALLGAATHKLSRLLSKSTVTRFLRAPFTDYHGPAGFSELKEKAAGTGLRRAIGQLVSCPFCTGVWVASFLTYGLAMFPGPTRVLSTVYAATAISDFLQLAYSAAEKALKPDTPTDPAAGS